MTLNSQAKEALIRLYANLVRNGSRTLESLPEEYQTLVKEYLEKNPSLF